MAGRWAAKLCFSLVAAAALGGCSKGVVGSGKATTETRTVSAFGEIEARGAMKLDVVAEGPASVVITGDDNLVPLVTTSVEGSKLVIGPSQDIDPKVPIGVSVHAPALRGLIASGATTIAVHGIGEPSFRLTASGASSVTLAGKTTDLDIDLSGVGNVDANDLDAANARVTLSGAGSATVVAHESLDARVSGAGSVRYGGDPKKVERSVSGVGSIDKK